MAITWNIVQQSNASGEFNLHDPDAYITGSTKIVPAYVTNSASVSNSASLVYVDMNSASQTLTLPDATVNEEMLIRIKNRGTISFTIDGSGTDTIDDELTIEVYNKEAFTLHADDSSNWNII